MCTKFHIDSKYKTIWTFGYPADYEMCTFLYWIAYHPYQFDGCTHKLYNKMRQSNHIGCGSIFMVGVYNFVVFFFVSSVRCFFFFVLVVIWHRSFRRYRRTFWPKSQHDAITKAQRFFFSTIISIFFPTSVFHFWVSYNARDI